MEVRCKVRKSARVVAALLLVTGFTIPGASAQSEEPAPTGLSLTTPYVGVATKPGETATFPIDVAAPPGTRVELSLAGVPVDWSSQLQGGGYVVDQVLVDETGHVEVTLNVDVPDTAGEDTYQLSVSGIAGNETSTLDLSIRVALEASGIVSLTTDFPVLQGPPDSTYSFSLDLDNATPQEIQFGLIAEGPAGWRVEIQPSGETRASTVTVAGGASATLNVDVTPPVTAPAGQYPIVARVEGGGQSASVELGVEVTGNYGLDMSTANSVLNTEVNAGAQSQIELVLTNSGSAPLNGIDLNAVPPRGWEVNFTPAAIDVLPSGESATVTAEIIPSDDAINGDYIVSFSATVPETRADMDLRTTVTTSGVWGLVGAGVIVFALVGLSLVFRQYGRR